MDGFFNRQVKETHPFKAKALGKFDGFFDQFGARFDAEDMAVSYSRNWCMTRIVCSA